MNRGPDAATGVTDVPLALDAVRILVLVVVLITVPLAQPHLGSGADGIGVAVALGVSTVSWVVWLAGPAPAAGRDRGPVRDGSGRRRPRRAVPAEHGDRRRLAWSRPPWAPG